MDVLQKNCIKTTDLQLSDIFISQVNLTSVNECVIKWIDKQTRKYNNNSTEFKICWCCGAYPDYDYCTTEKDLYCFLIRNTNNCFSITKFFDNAIEFTRVCADCKITHKTIISEYKGIIQKK